MRSFSLEEILGKLIGRTEPCGESEVDEIRYENFQTLKDCITILVKEVEYLTTYADSHQGSKQKIGKEADNYLKNLYDELYDSYGRELL